MKRVAWLAATVAMAAAPDASARAQSLAGRVSAVHNGTVLMSFPARPGVCGDGRGSMWTEARSTGGYSSSGHWRCVAGPVRVSIARADGEVVSVRTLVGGQWATGGPETNLGDVSAAEAAHYLLSLVSGTAGRNAGDAISAAVFADGVNIAADLRRLVRNDDVPIDVRKQALFWLGQSDDEPTTDLASLYDALEPFSLREHFVFVLSQRHDDPAISKLIELAQHAPDREIRKRAMFWLGQSKEPKATSFLRDILTR